VAEDGSDNITRFDAMPHCPACANRLTAVRGR
jgi:hypothetical protein